MTRDEFKALVSSIRADQDKLLTEKGADYTQKSDDVHKNFKVVAEETGQTPLQVWAVYAAKHWLAIMSYVKHGAVASEPIESRFRDLGNYLLLGEGLLPECTCVEWGQPTCQTPREEFICTMAPEHTGSHVSCDRSKPRGNHINLIWSP